MPKEFYTERDIEDMFKRGILSVQVDDNVVMTELAYEKAARLGMQLLQERGARTSGGTGTPVPFRLRKPAAAQAAAARKPEADLTARIRAAVNPGWGHVDPALLDVIIERVLKSTGVR